MADKNTAPGERKAARADVVPSSLNEEARTFEIVFATETPVRRRTWDGVVYEVLSLNPKHVRMERFQSGRAPFLHEHRSWDPKSHIGVIESARIENGRGIATVRMVKDDPDADRVWNKIRQGVLRSISVGYAVLRFEKVEGGDEKTPTFRATLWEPLEASSVAMPADNDSHIRSADERTPMDPQNNATENQTPDEIRAAERHRIEAISKLIRTARLPEELGRSLVDKGTPLEAARTVVLDELAKRSDNDGTSQAPSGAPTREFSAYEAAGQRGGTDDFRAAAVDGLLIRAGLTVKKPHAAAADMRHSSTVELARTCLSRSGVRFGALSPSETIKRAMNSGDFPQILTNAVHASIRNGFETEPATHRQWIPVESVPDFREQHRPILGSAPGLEPIAELGEYKFGSFNEDSTSYRVSKFGKAVALSWELLVGDRLGAFLRLQPALGQAARRKEADITYALFSENSGNGPTMQDGVPLFHTTHKNVTVASELNVAGLGAARLLMRRQTALDGGQLGITPRYLIVPPEMETDAEVLLATTTRAISAGTESDPQAWVRSLQPIVESRLDANAFYLACSSEQVDTLVLGVLDENMNGPIIEEDKEFVVDAYRMKVRHVVGAKVLDWRGLVKVPKP